MPTQSNLLDRILPALIVIGILIVIPVIYRIILAILTKSILKSPIDRRTPGKLIRLHMRSSLCGEGLHFKDVDDHEGKRYITVPYVVITSGGIHLFQLFARSGMIHSPRSGAFAIRNREGKWEPIPSPITASIQSAKSVRQILEKEQISNVPITFHVILLSERVRFSQMQEEFLPISDLVTLLRNQSKTKMLTGLEMKHCKKAILKHAGK